MRASHRHQNARPGPTGVVGCAAANGRVPVSPTAIRPDSSPPRPTLLCHNVAAMATDTPAPGTPPSPLTRRLLDLLESRDVPHRSMRHPAVRTSEEASRVRGTPLEAGAKALVCHADDRIVLIVVPADARLDNRAFKQQTGVKNVRMVDAAELEALVGAPVGAVPPFGSLFGLATYADRAVVGRE